MKQFVEKLKGKTVGPRGRKTSMTSPVFGEIPLVNQIGRTALSLAVWLPFACADSTWEPGRTSGGIYFESVGRGPPVVLVHGFSLDRRMWDAQVPPLRSKHRVLRYDLRGHGLSAPWKEPFSAVQDLLDVFDAAGLSRGVIVGLSAGAEIAVDFALAHPDRVAGLVLASPGLSGYQPVGSFDWMAPVMIELQAGEMERAMEAWAETPLMAIPGDPAADSVMRAIVRENWRIWTYDPGLQRPPDPPSLDSLSEITAPALVLIGESDLIDTKRVGDTLAACLPRVELVTIPEAGHLLNLEAPGAFAEAVLRFLEDPLVSAADSSVGHEVSDGTEALEPGSARQGG